MTITKRVTAIPSGGATQRITEAASGGQTKRITEAVEEHLSRRVAFDGHEAEYDPWAGSWGDAWGDTWRVVLSGSEIGHTFRVSGTASGGQTKRVTM